MSKLVKWIIVVAAEVAVTAIIYFCGVWFGKTLGPLMIFIIWAVIYALGYKWTRDPKTPESEEDNSDEK